MEVIHSFTQFGSGLFGPVWPVIWNSLKIVCVILPIFGCVAYLTLWERKAIGWMQVRKGPNRVGPLGLLQPIADALKLMLKEIIVPAAASKVLYIIAPIMTLMPALAAWAVMPFGPDTALANINAGLLYLLAITSIEVYGVILAGWASNSKYAFLGAMRASAQMVSYELAIGFAIVCVVMVSGSLNMTQIVLGQDKGYFADAGWNFLSWNWLPLLPIFVVYVISAIAETNRHPFDVVEGESEIVAGHMVEYSGMAFALFFLAEYANMILLSALAAVMFLGGWTAPIEFAAIGMKTPQFILDTMWFWNWLWLFAKTFFVVSMFIWARASFPRYRYDQIMRLGWKIFIPLTLAYIVLLAIWMYSPLNIWK